MEKREDIAMLIKKRLDGVQSAEEYNQLQRWASSNPRNDAFLKQVLEGEILQEGVLRWLALSDGNQGEWHKRLEKNVLHRIKSHGNRKSFSHTIYRVLPFAAAFTLFALAGGGYYFLSSRYATSENVQPFFDLPAGNKKAVLTFSDGRTLALSSEKEGIVVGDLLAYTGQYTPLDFPTGNYEDEPQYATLMTPAGGHYQITLPDGTKVWLNAASTLKFQTKSGRNKRIVELAGEAYFNVTSVDHDSATLSGRPTKVPFVVKTQHQEVEVLGTKFNVSAYADERETKTTLVEGSVMITSNSQRLQLQPGEQGTTNNTNLAKAPVDVAEFISWKNNLFFFNETELRTAMNQISRWYNIEVEYKGEMPKTYFYGEISRNKKLSEVLKILRAGGVTFKMEKGARGVNKLIVIQ